MNLREVADSAFNLRQFANPAIHRLVRLRPSDDGPRMAQLGTEYEPTAFMYAYVALNTLYNYEWPQLSGTASDFTDSSNMREASHRRERDNLKAFVAHALSGEHEMARFSYHCRRISAPSDSGVLEVLQGLYEFDEDGLRSQVIAAARRLHTSTTTIHLLDDAKTMFRAIYEVRCNIFHGAKSVYSLTPADGQYRRIGIFRQFTIALLDTFFERLRTQFPQWNPYFEGSGLAVASVGSGHDSARDA